MFKVVYAIFFPGEGVAIQVPVKKGKSITGKYSKIPILRPPLGLSKSGLKDHFGQSQRWYLMRDTLGVENEEKNNLNFANKVNNG